MTHPIFLLPGAVSWCDFSILSRYRRVMMPYERLKAWEACHALWLAVYHATKRWPVEERFGLSSQIRRASLSAAANIVEGNCEARPA